MGSLPGTPEVIQYSQTDPVAFPTGSVGNNGNNLNGGIVNTVEQSLFPNSNPPMNVAQSNSQSSSSSESGSEEESSSDRDTESSSGQYTGEEEEEDRGSENEQHNNHGQGMGVLVNGVDVN